MSQRLLLQHHSDTVYTIPGFISQSECTEFIEKAEYEGFAAAGVRVPDGQKMMPNIRNNDRIAISSIDWANLFWGKLSNVSLPEIEGLKPAGLSSLFRFYRYHPGQRFKMHKDGRLAEGSLESRMSFLVYLNADFEGGETDFRTFKIIPEVGMALLFIHETWHEGSILMKGTKYVLRSDVIYG